MPLSVTVPAPVFVSPAVPASVALALPAWMSNAVALVSVPLAIVPPVSCTRRWRSRFQAAEVEGAAADDERAAVGEAVRAAEGSVPAPTVVVPV